MNKLAMHLEQEKQPGSGSWIIVPSLLLERVLRLIRGWTRCTLGLCLQPETLQVHGLIPLYNQVVRVWTFSNGGHKVGPMEPHVKEVSFQPLSLIISHVHRITNTWYFVLNDYTWLHQWPGKVTPCIFASLVNFQINQKKHLSSYFNAIIPGSPS